MKYCLLYLSLLCSLLLTAQTNAIYNIRQQLKGTHISTEGHERSPLGTAEKQMYQGDSSKMGNADSVIRMAVLLPFDYTGSSAKMYGYMNDKELSKSDIYKLKESSTEGMDFYQGLQYALNHTRSRQKIEVSAYDTENNDSILQLILAMPALKNNHLIIGPASLAEAKTVASFCKRNGIINIQPFVASKSISSENPYLVRLMPTIDAHLQKEYEMVMDSFADKNIIVYTTKRERDLSAARQLDTLFKSYNAINRSSLRYTLVNSGDSSVPPAKRSLAAHLLPKEENVVLMTTYDESLVNSMLRSNKENTIVFGMPTWIDAEQIRADYLSNARPYFTDNFYADTAAAKVNDFILNFSVAYNQRPSRYAYMGYDVMNYLTLIFDKHGRNITDGINKESYEGLGYSFHISPVIHTAKGGTEVSLNYYANTAMHLFQVRDYKVWLIK